MVDLEEGADFIAAFPYRPGAKLLVAGTDGRGFIVPTDDVDGQYPQGQADPQPRRAGARMVICAEAEGDHVAIVGENRKLLVFPLTQMPEMTRGKGVRLQRYKDGGISDAKVFKLAEGLTWKDTAGRTWTVGQATTCATGSAIAPKPAACRRRAFRRATGLGERTETRSAPPSWPDSLTATHASCQFGCRE